MMFFPTVTWLRQPPTYNNHWTIEIPSDPFGRCNSKFAATWPRIHHRCHFCHYFKCLYDSVAMLTRGPSWCLLGLLISNSCQGGRCAVEIRWSSKKNNEISVPMCGRICWMFGTNQLLWQQICKKNFVLFHEQEIAHKQFAWPSSCQCQRYFLFKALTYLPKNEARPECHHRIGPSYPHLLCFHARFRPTSSNVDDPVNGPGPEHMGWHASGCRTWRHGKPTALTKDPTT